MKDQSQLGKFIKNIRFSYYLNDFLKSQYTGKNLIMMGPITLKI